MIESLDECPGRRPQLPPNVPLLFERLLELAHHGMQSLAQDDAQQGGNRVGTDRQGFPDMERPKRKTRIQKKVVAGQQPQHCREYPRPIPPYHTANIAAGTKNVNTSRCCKSP